MDARHTAFLGIRQPPRELSVFERQAFFMFDVAECAAIDERRNPALRLGLAHIGFLRMRGRSLDAFRIVPPALWVHLGAVLGCEVPQLASLRALCRRRSTLFEHQHRLPSTRVSGIARASAALLGAPARRGTVAAVIAFHKVATGETCPVLFCPRAARCWLISR